jgi:hypothetical protein
LEWLPILGMLGFCSNQVSLFLPFLDSFRLFPSKVHVSDFSQQGNDMADISYLASLFL